MESWEVGADIFCRSRTRRSKLEFGKVFVGVETLRTYMIET